MEGTIKRVKKDGGFGFITGTDGKKYFFHSSALKNAEFTSLSEGQDVTFEDVDGSKGLRAEDVFVG